MYKKLAFLQASMCGVGYCPFASGTAGSLATLPVAFVLAYYFGVWGVLLGTIVIFFMGVIATKEVLKYTKHDPSIVVIDEMAGQILSFVLVAEKLHANNNIGAFMLYALGFGLFRLFDITKPQPARWADSKVLNAWGVMLDDIFAGIYAALLLYGIDKFLML